MQPTRLRPLAYWRKPRKQQITRFPSTLFRFTLLRLCMVSQRVNIFICPLCPWNLLVKTWHHFSGLWCRVVGWLPALGARYRKALIFKGIFFYYYDLWFVLQWEVGTGYRNCLTSTAYWVVLSGYSQPKNVVVKYSFCVAEDFVFLYCKQH